MLPYHWPHGTARSQRAGLAARRPGPRSDIVVPVRDEERAPGRQRPAARRLPARRASRTPPRITIAENGSSDGTWEIAQSLVAELRRVRAIHLDAAGRGGALKAAWRDSDAEVLAYMDVDLSTGLNALPPLVAPLLSGHSDLAIGTRLARGARVTRGLKREVHLPRLQPAAASRARRALLGRPVRLQGDPSRPGRQLLPLVEDTGWFFDTELLVLAQRAGLRIHEVPVDWTDDPDSRVDIAPTALADLRGIARVRSAPRQGTLAWKTPRS